MKIFAVFILVVALYLLYRIACSQPSDAKKGNLATKTTLLGDVIGRSRTVSTVRGQPQPTVSTSGKQAGSPEKADIFVPETGPIGRVIPPEELDEVFSDDALAGGWSYDELLTVIETDEIAQIKAVIDRNVEHINDYLS